MPLFFIYTTLIVVLNIQFCLETFLQAMSAVLKCLLVQKSNVIVTWPVRPCYFSMEQNLSLTLGIMKFHNELPWHGFVQSFYCVFPESIKFWNMSISSEKFFQWFLWKFLHVFSFWNSYPLAFGPPDRLTVYIVLLFSISFSFCFTFWKIFFNLVSLSSIEFLFLCSLSESYKSSILFLTDSLYLW